jgi:flagellum-specific ATP synthase
MNSDFSLLAEDIGRLTATRRYGHVAAIGPGSLTVAGLSRQARIGDIIAVQTRTGPMGGEIVALDRTGARVMTYGPADGVGLGDAVALENGAGLWPDLSWAGRIVDAFGVPLDGRPIARGPAAATLRAAALPAAWRKPVGRRLKTGLAAFDAMLPLARGQRIGIFAGSGVGKSSLLAALAREVEADVVVLALIGERGRELRHFTDAVLGPAGLARSVVVAATSDQSPLIKRRAAWTAMAVAEAFRDAGRHVLLLVDSVTRFAEAHREIALTAGEPASLRAFPPSTASLVAALTERAGPGLEASATGRVGNGGAGDITAVFSVLVAGSDMEEPVADITRGLLDGHVVLDRNIAERGRFPAIDVRRSVSRALPEAATAAENRLILRAREILGVYEAAEPMIQTGLYVKGADARLDRAVAVWPALDQFFTQSFPEGPPVALARLAEILGE